MAEWFADGRILYAVVSILSIELLTLIVLVRKRARSAWLIGLMPTVASGALLAIALVLMQLPQLDWRYAATGLALSGLMHVADVAMRMRRHVREGSGG